MFEIFERSTDSVFGIRVTGKVTEEDYQRILPDLKRVIDEHGEVNFLCRFDGLSGMEPEALWKDVKFSVRHFQDFARCAIVKDQDWQRALTPLGSVFGIEVRTFEPNEEDAAWEWLFSATQEAPSTAAGRRVRRRSRAIRLRLDALAQDVRSDINNLEDPRAQALFETTAEVALGLRTAFEHFEKRSEAAWREEQK